MVGLLRFKKQKTSRIDKNKLITDARYVVIDTELTGLNEKRDSIVSIGVIRMVGGKIDLSDTFYQLVKPEAAFTAESVVIHEITPSEVQEKPDILAVLSEFLQFCGSDIVVGHCVSIDLSFLHREMRKFFGYSLQNPVLDTFSLYNWLRTRASHHRCFSISPRSCGLYDVAECLGIPVQGAHNAIEDAFITAQLFQRLIPVLIESGIKNIGDLLSVGNPSEWLDRVTSSGEISNL